MKCAKKWKKIIWWQAGVDIGGDRSKSHDSGRSTHKEQWIWIILWGIILWGICHILWGNRTSNMVRETDSLRKWLTQLWRLARVKSSGQASRLETQGRVHKAVWKQNSFLLKSLQLKPSANWMRPTHIIESNLLYSRYSDLNVSHILKIPSQRYPAWCLTKHLDTAA